MTIGGGIALIVLGAVLAFGVELEIAGLNIDVIGFILMLAGAVGLIFGLVSLNRTRTVTRRPADTTTVVEERRDVL